MLQSTPYNPSDKPATKTNSPCYPELARRNSKPRERFGVVLEPPFRLPGYLFVRKPEGGEWWVLESICEVVEE